MREFLLTICSALFLVACDGGGSSGPLPYPEDSSELMSSAVESSAESSSEMVSSVGESSSSEESSSSVDSCFIDEYCFRDKRDGHAYRTVKIGDQIWMAENLNYRTDNSRCGGSPIEDCEKYGRLYSWSDAMDSSGAFSKNGAGCGYRVKCVPAYPVRGICPEGWHLPNKSEWEVLLDSVGGWLTAGTKLKASTGWADTLKGVDEYGFSALPISVDGDADFWSSETQNIDHARYLHIDWRFEEAVVGPQSIPSKLSIRCIKGNASEGEASVIRSSSSKIESSSSSVFATPCKTETEDNCEYGSLIDERDGQVYKTVKIGEQWWMAENLNYAYLQPTSTLDSSSWCYNDSAEYCEKFGRLYLWSAAMDSAALFSEGSKNCGYLEGDEFEPKCSVVGFVQGVCPEKWHIPSEKESRTLLNKTRSLCESSNVHQNDYKFEIQPGGFYYAEPNCCTIYPWSEKHFFEHGDETAFLWLASEQSSAKAYCDFVDALNCETGGPTWSPKFFAYSVRCVKD